MDDSPLRTHLLDLHAMLEPRGVVLTLGGGYGLFLKQRALAGGEQTLFPVNLIPPPRATEDIDVLLDTEVVASSGQMALIINALRSLSFQQEVAKWRYRKDLGPGKRIHVDLLTGPDTGFDHGKLKLQGVTVGPVDEVGVNARRMDEALALDTHATFVTIEGSRADLSNHIARIRLPHPFTFLVTKLITFADRDEGSVPNSEDRRKARVQAIDLYRVIGMLTQTEYGQVLELAEKFRDNDHFRRACEIVAEYFAAPDGLGVIRMRENNPPNLDRLADFLKELGAIFRL
jgi:hypothetical protein